jgi:short-subunit dehydrogenase
VKLKGKKAVVIGASGGIGRVLSMALAMEGTEVFLVARRKNILNALKNKIKDKGGNSHTITADVTKKSGVAKVLRILKKQKRVDVLIHAAGVGVYKDFEDVTLDEWKKSFDVNVTSVFRVTQKLMPLLKKSKKSYVIATGSGMGKIGVAGRSPYCASKFALRGLMLSLAKEYKKTNVHFILLTMGSILTSFGPLSLEEKAVKKKEGKKYLKPSKLAHTIISKLENDTLERETTIYPSNYFKESKKGKT